MYFGLCSLSGSSVHGISQGRILEWVAISSSRGSFRSKDQTCVSCIAGEFFTTEPLEKPLGAGSGGWRSAERTN